MPYDHREPLSEREYAHLRAFLASFSDVHGITYAEMSRRADMGDGSIAAVVLNRKPTRLFVRRLMRAFDATEDEILGPKEPVAPAMPLFQDAHACVGDAVTSTPSADMLAVLRDILSVLHMIHQTIEADRSCL